MNEPESEWKDANSSSSDLSKQGRTAITCIAGGILLFVLLFVSKLRVVGLAVGVMACVMGLSSLFVKKNVDYKVGAIMIGAGVLVLLSKTRFHMVTAVAGTALSIGAVALVVVGILKAVKLAWDVRNRS